MAIDPLGAALEGVDEYVGQNKSHSDAQVMRVRVRAIIQAYHSYWGQSNQNDFEVIGVEEILMGPIKNLKTGKDSGYLAGGMIDVRLQEISGRKQRLIMDHKMLSGEMDQQDIDHLLIDGQPNQYAYLEHAAGNRVDAAIWDVCAKTKHRPTKEKITTRKPSKKEPEGARTVTPAETLEEFEERLLAVYLENPQKYFARPRVPIERHNVIEHVSELYDWARELDTAKITGNHLRNTEFCFDHMKPCKYLGICTGRSYVEDGTWGKRDRVHPELDLDDSVDQMKLLSNSRVKAFKGCRRKHDLAYNQGLVKLGEQLEEPLFVGSCAHKALEHYWKAIAANQGREL